MLGVFTGGLTLVIGFALGLIALITSTLASLSASILQWVTSGNFITLSYTNAGVLPGDPRFNEFVSMGWELTRGLTNIIFVVAMVAIGLGTALGRAEYQAKKALPVLIIIAILINFTPVLLGLVIDASNIVMNYFLSAVGGFGFFANNMGAVVNSFSTALGKFFDPSAQLNLVIGLLVMIVFSILSGIVFFLFSLLFIGRYIALWLLVILSPFALACYILPATKKYYTQWLEQLTQWCIIGITGGFFLYLASKMIDITSNVSGSAMKGLGGFTTDQSNPLSFFFGSLGQVANQILPWGISLALMFVGLSMGLTTGAMGGKMMINWGKKLPGNISKSRLGGKLLGGAAAGTQKGLAGTSGFLQKHLGKDSFMGKIPVIGRGFSRPLGWMAKSANEAVSPKLIEYAATKRKTAAPKGWDQMSIPEKENYINAQTFASDKLVLASKMKSEGTYKHSNKTFKAAMIENAKKMASNGIYKKEVGDIKDATPEKITAKMELDAELDPIKKKELEKKFDNFANELSARATVDVKLAADIMAEAKNRGLTEKQLADPIASQQFLRDVAASKMYVEKMKSGDMKGANIDSLAFRLGSQNFTSGHFQQIEQEFGKDGLEKVITGTGGVGTLSADEFYKKNEGLFKNFITNPALSYISIDARDQMTDADDQKTKNFDTYERGQNIKEIIKDNPAFDAFNKDIKSIKDTIISHEKSTKTYEIERGRADMDGRRTDAARAQGEITKIQKEIKKSRLDIDEKISRLPPDLKGIWEKIENMKQEKKKNKKSF